MDNYKIRLMYNKIDYEIGQNKIKYSRIAFKKPSLNDQLDSRRLILFRNGIT